MYSVAGDKDAAPVGLESIDQEAECAAATTPAVTREFLFLNPLYHNAVIQRFTKVYKGRIFIFIVST
jgi:hypothetical protein